MTSSGERHTTQSHCARLGDDELRTVFDFAVDDSVDRKFAISQVSSHWRAVALCSSTFWTSFTVRSLLDSHRLRMVIERTASALLDVSLDFTARKELDRTQKGEPVFSEFERYRVYSTLGRYSPRIRRLALDLGELDHPFVWCSESLTPLFTLPSPYLEDLSLRWRPEEWLPKSGNRFIRCLTEPIVVPLHDVPRLRRIRLENMVPAVWRRIAAPTLESFDVRSSIHDPFLLSGILFHCPLVASLTVLPKGPLSTNFSNRGVPAISITNLHTVHIGMPFLNTWAILGTAVDFSTVHEITVTIDGYEPGVTTGLVYEKLLQHSGAVVSCSLLRSDPDSDPSRPGSDVYNIVDATGRSRSVIVTSSMNHYIHAFWQAILNSPDGMNQLRSMTLSHFVWFTTSFFLTRQSTLVPVANLRIILPPSPTGLSHLIAFIKDARPRRFHYPRVTQITFEAVKDQDEYIPIVLDLLNSIQRDCDLHPAEVCVPFEGKTARWVTTLHSKLDRPENWTTCSHCARPAQGKD